MRKRLGCVSYNWDSARKHDLHLKNKPTCDTIFTCRSLHYNLVHGWTTHTLTTTRISQDNVLETKS